MSKNPQKSSGVVIKRSSAGLGLFASRNFKKGAFIIEYTGTKLTHEEADKKGGKYLFILNSRVVIDGYERKNTARYINHSCIPNCEAIIEDDQHIMIFAKKNIHSGEELTYHYGKEYFRDMLSSHCRCQKCFKK